ncbi:amphi-Trp domain-containing protein [Halopenitus persicus]|uniref:Amphi-Trp domain-containing protein n=1 Tax=Halopenitus persicus TaxID=1048396 RepID=A0A1H3DMW4_9EURY|nr:amphi-Trp domain-containing protein [Halopenitus persicus]QHS16309.1 amphi-Trp domain-containing protein [haloarchaeon 3A1-DGR]SDX67731.1 amphi-Trp domain-containing protein [Halopenitus persicus]
MPEETIFATESVESRESIAASLRAVADKLEAGEPVTLAAGEESVSLTVPPRATFEVQVERETGSGSEEQSVEFEIEWDVGADGDGTEPSLSIE